MEYSKIPSWFKEQYNKKFEKKSLTLKEIESDITLWTYFMIGLKLRLYQAWCIHSILNSKTKRISLCWARQLGKSIDLGIFSFWSTFYNKFPATVEKITTCYIMSRDDDTAKEFLEKIRGLIKMGDKQVYKIKKVRKYFSQHYGKPDNQHQITWSHNRSFIKSVPPTDTVVGKSASIFIIDECAKLKVLSPYTDKRLYYEVIEPTTSETGGFLIMSSTPNGASGVFYDIFDPDDKHEIHEFSRIWFSYEINPDSEYRKFVEDKKRIMELKGELKLWQQEYMAMFTVTQSSLFEVEDIEKGIDYNLTKQYEWQKSDCSLGIDYGMNPSRTVLTIKAVIGNKITTINQIRFSAGFDDNKLMDENFENSIPNLWKRYKIRWIIADDCPQGVTLNNWMKNKGYPIKLFNFRSDQTKGERNRGYYKYRSALRIRKIKYPNLKDLIEEMKILEEIQLNVNISIKSPRGSLCDCIDSEMMATLPFLEEKNFTSCTTGFVRKVKYPQQNLSLDKEWEDIQFTQNNLWVIDELKRKGGIENG